MSYQPRPIDTSGVNLDSLGLPIEAIAEHVHDTWTAGRIADEWPYGPSKDDTKKYKKAAFVSTWAAVLSVLLAIYQLSGFPTGGLRQLVLPLTELILVIVAIGLVLRAFEKVWHEGWLTERAKAESLRALKYSCI